MGEVLKRVHRKSRAERFSHMTPRQVREQAPKEEPPLSESDTQWLIECAHAGIVQECMESRNPFTRIRGWLHRFPAGTQHNPDARSYQDPDLR